MPPKTNRSDGRAVFQAWNIEHNPSVILTQYHSGRISRADSIDRLERTDRYGKLTAAHLAIEQAMEASNFDKTNSWIERARVNLDVVSATDTSGSGMDGHKARALLDLSQLPLMAYLACFGELPPVNLVRSAYGETIQAVDKITTAHKLRRDPVLSGLLAEAGVILLGQRYALNALGDGSWLPTHSLHSEDHANHRHHDENRAWDVTFHADLGAGPEKSYLVQVKSDDGPGRDERRYTDGHIEGIIPLHFNPDLTYETEGYNGLINTFDELIAEAYGDSRAATTLDYRTEKLLDVLG